MVSIIQDLTKVNYNTKWFRKIKYIVIHYTGNKTDSANGNANYFRNINRGSSAHYFVDNYSIVQVVKDSDVAWAVGRNYGSDNLFGIVTNDNSISIEMCSDNSEITNATFKNTVELTKMLMNKYGISSSNVYRHYDVCSKICPGWNGWVRSDESLWNKFKAELDAKPNPHNNDAYTITGEGTKLWAFETLGNCDVHVAPNSQSDIVTTLCKGSKQGITKVTDECWGCIGNGVGWINLRDCKPLSTINYKLAWSKCNVRKGNTLSSKVAVINRGSVQPFCFIGKNKRGLIANYTGWTSMKHFKKI